MCLSHHKRAVLWSVPGCVLTEWDQHCARRRMEVSRGRAAGAVWPCLLCRDVPGDRTAQLQGSWHPHCPCRSRMGGVSQASSEPTLGACLVSAGHGAISRERLPVTACASYSSAKLSKLFLLLPLF